MAEADGSEPRALLCQNHNTIIFPEQARNSKTVNGQRASYRFANDAAEAWFFFIVFQFLWFVSKVLKAPHHIFMCISVNLVWIAQQRFNNQSLAGHRWGDLWFSGNWSNSTSAFSCLNTLGRSSSCPYHSRSGTLRSALNTAFGDSVCSCRCERASWKT